MRFSASECTGTYAHVARVGLRADLANKRSGSGLDELLQSLLLDGLSVDVLALVERLVQDDGGLLDTLSLGNGGVVGGTEEVLVAETLGDSGEGLVGSLVVLVEVGDQNNLVGGLELLEAVLGEGRNGGKRLLGHVRNDAAEPFSPSGWRSRMTATYASAFLWPAYGAMESRPRKTLRVG